MADEYKSSGENTDGAGNGFDTPGSSGLRDKQIKRQLDDSTSLWAQLRHATQELNKKNIFEAAGVTTAKVLKCRKSTKDDFIPSANFLSELFLRDGGADAPSELVQCWCRDELRHSHLPVPSGEDDLPRIMMHTVYTAQTDDFQEPKPKDTVKIDYEDKKNPDRGGILIEVVNKKTSSGGVGAPEQKCQGTGAFDQNGATGQTPVSVGGSAVAGTPVDFGQSGPISEKIKAKNAGATALVCGDSQSQGKLGKEVAKYLRDQMGYTLVDTTGAGKFHGSPNRFSRHGAKPIHYTTEGGDYSNFRKGVLSQFKPFLATKPSLVCFIGGGNGVSAGDPTKLINTIRGIAGNCAILWIGPPTAVPAKSPSYKDNTDFWIQQGDSYIPAAGYKAKRRKLAETISKEMQAFPNAIFIDAPTLTPKYNSVGSADGIHVNESGAKELVENMKKQGSPAPGGEAFSGIEGYIPNKFVPDSVATGGFKKGTFAQKKDLFEKFKSDLSPEKARKFLEDASDRMNISMQEILGRNFASGFLQKQEIVPTLSVPFSEQRDLSVCDDIPPNISDLRNAPILEWAPPNFEDIGKFYGIKLPPPENANRLVRELELNFGGDTINAITPEKQYAEQIVEKQKQLAQSYIDNPAVINLPGAVFPTNPQDVESLQSDLALKIEASKEIIQEDLNKKQEQAQTGQTADEQEKPEETTTTSPPSTVGSSCPPGSPIATGNGTIQNYSIPEINMNNYDWKVGALGDLEERLKVLIEIHKKLGLNKYHMAMTFAIWVNEGGRITEPAHLGDECGVGFEPHVSSAGGAGKTQYPESPWGAAGCKASNCKEWGEFCVEQTGQKLGKRWSAIQLASKFIGAERAHQAATYGRMQTFWQPKYADFNLGKSAIEFAQICRESEEAQFWCYYAYTALKPSFYNSLKNLQPQVIGRFYNGAVPGENSGFKYGSPYGYRLECIYRGVWPPRNNQYYRQSKKKCFGIIPCIDYVDLNWMVGNKTTNGQPKSTKGGAKDLQGLTPEMFVPNPKAGTDIIPDF